MKILVAPLNWGLGHATRCVPLIRHLEHLGHQVVLASDGVALHLLRAEFPHLPTVELPSYRIRYDTRNMVWNIARQLPRILFAVRAERWATERLVRSEGITHVLSDNRYGCFSRRAKSVILTHQIHLKVPGRLLSWLANGVLRLVLNKFDEVWVPDTADAPHLAGSLAHPPLERPRTRYLGVLSRFSPQPNPTAQRSTSSTHSTNINHIAVVLSGPEPQRTVLEQRLLEQVVALPQHVTVVQGKPQRKEHHFVAEHVEVISYLTTHDLQTLLRQADVVICRAGYSSVMDLAVLGKRALLIPTPGQTEQEYLARNLARQGLFVVQNQDNLNVEAALEQMPHTTGWANGALATDRFAEVVESWLASD